jgi:hypothetical protein
MAVAIAYSVTKLLTRSSMFKKLGKGEVCQLQLLLQNNKTSVIIKELPHLKNLSFSPVKWLFTALKTLRAF